LELDRPIANGGYRWVYVDALSDDGKSSIVVIAMLGAPFSPWYARARNDRRDPGARSADPLRHSAFNVAIYGQRGAAWSLHETDRVERGAERVQIGSSGLERRGERIDVSFDGPGGRRSRVRGRCRIEAPASYACVPEALLDTAGRHRWRMIAPVARVQVALVEPETTWSGWGYVDTNDGDEPLEQAFRGWAWSRAHLAGGGSAVSYETHARDGSTMRIARRLDARGETAPIELAEHPLPSTRWGLPRTVRADAGEPPRLVRSLEDTPFYARTLVDAMVAGERTRAMHETLSLDRFRAPWVQFLLPFRIHREAPQ
jgi:carotenoid 1,2-hydratase